MQIMSDTLLCKSIDTHDVTQQEYTRIWDKDHSHDEEQCHQPKKWDHPKWDMDKRGKRMEKNKKGLEN